MGREPSPGDAKTAVRLPFPLESDGLGGGFFATLPSAALMSLACSSHGTMWAHNDANTSKKGTSESN